MNNRSFLEKLWILFSASIYVEGIIKDLIIFAENPKFIKEINVGTISDGLKNERRNMLKMTTFNSELIKRFTEKYPSFSYLAEIFEVIMYIRDVIGHCRISVDEGKLWMVPKNSEKMKRIQELFNIKWDWEALTITNEKLDLDTKIASIEKLDAEIFPNIANSIWLDYARIR